MERRLAAILAADVVGYSRLMGEDEAGTHAGLQANRRELIDPKIAEHHGRIVKLTGDGALVEFASVVNAVACAVGIQRAMAARNADVPEDRRMEFRIGINLGDIIVEEDDIYGDGVNVAARLQEVAAPGSIAVSDAAYMHLSGKIDPTFDNTGEHKLKNIAKPVRVWQWPPMETGRPSAADPSLAEKSSIAVLAFDNASGDPEQEYFADGITEEIITELSRLRWFQVIARNSSFSYKGKNVNLRQVGHELGARFILQGSVRKAGKRVRITCHLIDADTGSHIWADRYDGALEDIFDLQDQITHNIVQAIEPSFLSAESKRAHRIHPEKLDAWDLTMRALPHVWNMSESGLEEARRLLERALELDPRYASASSLLSLVFIAKAMCGWSDTPLDDYQEADRLALKAIELDASDPWPYACRSAALAVMGEHDKSVVQARHAVVLDPNCVLSRLTLSTALLYNHDAAGALAEIEKTQELSPRDPWMFLFMQARGAALAATGRYAEAAQALERSVALRSDYLVAQTLLACTYVFLDRLEDARATVAALLRLQPKASIKAVYARRHIRDPRYLDALREAGLPEE